MKVMKLSVLISICGALAALGCGSDDKSEDDGAGGSGGGKTADPACAPAVGPINPAAVLDDFEDGDADLTRNEGRQSQWWMTPDGTAGESTPVEGMVIPERIVGGRCEKSLYGLHMSGQGFTDWGAVMSVSMRWEDGPGVVPVDLSHYRGFRFFARAGELNTATLRFGVHDVHSHENGGICDPTTMEIGVGCWDSFGIDVKPLGTEWSEYAISFSALEQRDFGVKAELDTSQVFQIDFLVSPNSIFDVWIDDVWLFE
jgi:hypothetical protein